MIQKINSAIFNNYKYKYNVIRRKNISFHSSSTKVLRNLGMTVVAATMLMAAESCNQKVNNSRKIVVEVEQRTEKNDSMSSTLGKYNYNENTIKKRYHYFPTDKDVTGDSYNWSETIYPDGRIERDSMGHNILIDSDGKRTDIVTEKDEFGNLVVTTVYPDGTKTVKISYNTPVNVTRYDEMDYWANGNLKERNCYNEYFSEKEDSNKVKIIEKCNFKYNENEVLLSWNSNIPDSTRTILNNQYDKKGRLIYDDIKNEKYEYKKGSNSPHRAISEYEGCQRIKLFNSDGTVKKEFFKAKDGTISNVSNE